VWLGQEVQALPRRLNPPEPPLVGTAICLDPITADAAGDLEWLARDEETRRFTRVPSVPRGGFGADWASRYVKGWEDGTRAGFQLRALDGTFLGLAMFVHIDHEGHEGEAGYVVAPEARGRGVASEALRLLTEWGFAGLGLERIELRIEVVNEASQRVAARCGYTREGVLRSLYFKQGRRQDTELWSRLATDS
jgi:RimJ/RimL family protein N-acetyltransferase